MSVRARSLLFESFAAYLGRWADDLFLHDGRMRSGIVMLCATVALMPALYSEPPVLAVLEYPQCAKDSVLAVRPLFARTKDRWIPLVSSDSAAPFDLHSVEWTVAFDGRNLGTVRTTDAGFHSEYAWTYPRDRRLDVAASPPPPRMPNSRHAFQGWCSAPPTRPLVLVTLGNYRDPDHWERFDPPSLLQTQLFADFRKAVGRVMNCPEDPEKAVPFAYTPKHVVVRSGYRDRSGRKLVALQLRGTFDGCDGLPDGDEWSVHWFLLDRGTRYIGANLELVDAGDYDGDGASEILFWRSEYNLDGYALFYDGLRRHVDFSWSYH